MILGSRLPVTSMVVWGGCLGLAGLELGRLGFRLCPCPPGYEISWPEISGGGSHTAQDRAHGYGPGGTQTFLEAF